MFKFKCPESIYSAGTGLWPIWMIETSETWQNAKTPAQFAISNKLLQKPGEEFMTFWINLAYYPSSLNRPLKKKKRHLPPNKIMYVQQLLTPQLTSELWLESSGMESKLLMELLMSEICCRRTSRRRDWWLSSARQAFITSMRIYVDSQKETPLGQFIMLHWQYSYYVNIRTRFSSTAKKPLPLTQKSGLYSITTPIFICLLSKSNINLWIIYSHMIITVSMYLYLLLLLHSDEIGLHSKHSEAQSFTLPHLFLIPWLLSKTWYLFQLLLFNH